MAPRVPMKIGDTSPEGDIARSTGRSETAVTRIIRAFRDDGTLADAKRSGRPRFTTHEDDILIVAAENTMLPYVLDWPFPDGCFIFQQDKSPVHMARQVAMLENLGVRKLPWPPCGADANRIENLLSLSRATADALWNAIQEEREALRPDGDYVASLYISTRRMSEIISVNGHFMH
ncbi:hypothetical protein HPB52_012754 [Rhipicephalus sanguineus]|uniref:Uncharacterized protein n=1 Tax=Rhipicephalus sanguineus TaxID=34632 RepID=A0A9D4PZP3_RHISA|nr:hypothetical protein HPB52_012754 [Rhipicephalus sanguineus]